MFFELPLLADTMSVWAAMVASASAEDKARFTQVSAKGGLTGSEGQVVDNIADRASVRNVFAEPWMLEAASAHLVGASDVRLHVSRESGEVVGMMPVIFHGRSKRWKAAAAWTHLHSFESTPLVLAGHEERFLQELFEWLEAQGASVLRWPRVCLDGEFSQSLFRWLQKTDRLHAVVHSYARPVLAADVPCAEKFLAEHLSAKRRRDIARCKRRLAELGELSFRTMTQQDDPTTWLGHFLRLEASGWKGEEGSATALACRDDERAYFSRVFCEAAARGQLIAHSLEIDGQPIAMTVNWRSGGAVWAFKVAYDESYARFSPGVVLEIEGTRAMIEDREIAWVDSCSDADNELMRQLWPAERRIGDLVISVRPGQNLELPARAIGERWIRRLRERARAVYRQAMDRRRALIHLLNPGT